MTLQSQAGVSEVSATEAGGDPGPLGQASPCGETPLEEAVHSRKEVNFVLFKSCLPAVYLHSASQRALNSSGLWDVTIGV